MDNYFRGKECNKRGILECNKIHSDATRTEFEQHPGSERFRDEYEREYLAFLDKLIADANAIIRRERPLARPLAPQVRLRDTATAEVHRWEEEMKELTLQAEELAEEGKLAESRACLEKVRLTGTQIEMKRESYTYMCGEEVCDVCGLRYVIGDSREDKTNSVTHRRSRMHTGYVLIREKAEEVRAKIRERAKAREREAPAPGVEKDDSGRSRRQASRSRSRRRRRCSRSRSTRRKSRSRSRGGRSKRKARSASRGRRRSSSRRR